MKAFWFIAAMNFFITFINYIYCSYSAKTRPVRAH